MISKARKAELMRKWSAIGQVWLCMGVFLAALLATLILTVLGVFFDIQVSSLLPTNIAALIAMTTGLLRLLLLRRGWCAVSAHEVKHLPTYFKTKSHLYPIEIDGSKPMHMEDGFAADILNTCKHEGFVSWADFHKLGQKHGENHNFIEWIFIGRGQDAPASLEEWADLCSDRARLDFASEKAKGAQAARRL